MIDWLTLLAFVCFLTSLSLIMRLLHRSLRHEWVQLGEPIGPLWAPRELIGDLFIGVASSRTRSGLRASLIWLFFTPLWIMHDTSGDSRHLLMAARISFAALLIIIPVNFYASLST